MNVTIFKDIKDTSTPFHRDVMVILDRIRDGKSKEIVGRVRSEKNKDMRNIAKQELPAICFSGEFTKREDKAIVKHSGLICIDFDNFPSKSEMGSMREFLINDKYTFSVFTSPSGNGLKVLVKIPADADKHRDYFEGLQAYYNSDYFDKSCKNVSRVCYESYDPLIHINENSDTWTKIAEKEYKHLEVGMTAPTIRVSDSNEVVRRLKLWWEKKYGIVVGERNNNLFKLAAAFNDFGISKDMAHYLMLEYQHDGFPASEIRTIVDSAYRATEKFNTKFFEDTDALDTVKRQIKMGVPKKEVRTQLRDAGVEDSAIDAVIYRAEEESKSAEFWTKSEKGVVSIAPHLFKQFLEDNGFRKYRPEGSDAFIFVKVTNSLISNTSEDLIKDFVLNYLENLGDMSVYNHFADKTKYFKEDYLKLMSPVDVYFIQDTKDTAYLYFRNCAVQVKADEFRIIDYLDLNGFVWKDQVIQRDFEDCNSTRCDFKQFIRNISGKDSNRIASIESTIGYLMHGYKMSSKAPAVIINDEVISDNPEGGTGKGLFVNGVSKMKKMVTIDGKAFNFERSFAYQLVSADTQVLTFDDVRKHFDFERLFSIVTEGITLEKKNKDAIKIPFEKSPKIVITTNYAIKGSGNSFARRKWELEFKKYYSKDFTPYEEFGRMLFSEWDTDEWCRFDNYMITCLQLYLENGLIESDFVNLKERKFHAETCKEFADWCKDEMGIRFKYNTYISLADIMAAFTNEYPDFGARGKYSISTRQMSRWMVAYNRFMFGMDTKESRNARGKTILIQTSSSELDEEEIPF